MKQKYEFKDNSEPFELLMCPYCGSRLNRVELKDINILPTSCKECGKHGIGVKIMTVKEVIIK